jgi:hypothetical protein
MSGNSYSRAFKISKVFMKDSAFSFIRLICHEIYYFRRLTELLPILIKLENGALFVIKIIEVKKVGCGRYGK